MKQLQLNQQLSLFDNPIVQQEVIGQEVVEQETFNWTENDIHELRLGMLITAVKEIRDLRKSKAMRVEAWGWLFDEESNAPFSAEICAKHTGYDIEELRQLLLQIVPSP